jgi:hypothetical protein
MGPVSVWWSWVLSGLGGLGLWLTGRRLAVGWAVTMATEAVWVVYACVTRQWGFIPGAALYATVSAHAWRSWANDGRSEANNGIPSP